MGYYRLSSFDQVVKAYESIQPIRGARLSENLRPLANRKYWWHRVYKISDTKYILCDGYWASWAVGITEATAPILWERKEDGDYLTVRSHKEGVSSVSRYIFLQSFLPMGMFFKWPNGKHFVSHNGKEFYLPKFKGETNYQNKTFTMYKDNKLVFKAVGDGNFELVGDLLPMQTRRVDKDVNVIYKSKITEMWNWMQAVLPVMGNTMLEGKQEYAEQLTKGKGTHWYWRKNVDPNFIREILDNPEHECRLALAVLCVNECSALYEGRFNPTKEALAKFRRVIRTVGDMYAVDML